MGSFICVNLNLLHPRMLCAKCGLVLEKIIKFRQYISTLLLMYKLESPLPKDALYVLSLVEIGPSVLEKKKNVKSL